MQVKKALFFFVFVDFIKIQFKTDLFEEVLVDQYAELVVFFHLDRAGTAFVKGFVDNSAEDHFHDFFGGLHVGRNLGLYIEVREYFGQRGAVGVAKGVKDLLGGGLAHGNKKLAARGVRANQSYCTAGRFEVGLCMRIRHFFNPHTWTLLGALAAAACSGSKQRDCTYAAPQFDPTALAKASGFDSIPRYSSGHVALDEASGGAYCSWDSTGFWVIEDGGAGPQLHLVNRISGRVKATLQLNAGWTNVDWEDLTHWTDTTGLRWLGLAEVGDNNALYPTRAIYALPEPTGIDTLLGTSVSYTPDRTMTWNFVYEDGPRDAESVFTDPLDGRMYVVTKREARNRVYVLPSTPSTGLDTARAVADLPIFMSTAADRSLLPGERAPIAIRSYGRLYFWEAKASEPACVVLQRTPTELPYTDQEAQGEIFVWMPDGSYLLLSERLGNAAPKVHCYRPLP